MAGINYVAPIPSGRPVAQPNSTTRFAKPVAAGAPVVQPSSVTSYSPVAHSATVHQAPQPGSTPPPPPSGGGSGAGNLDASYFTQAALNNAKLTNSVNALMQQGAYAQTGLDNQIHGLEQQRPLAMLKQEIAANRQGGLFSAGYGLQQGRLDQSFLGREAGLREAFAKSEAARQSRIQGLTDNAGVMDERAREASALRLAGQAAKDPGSAGAPSPNAPAPPPASASDFAKPVPAGPPVAQPQSGAALNPAVAALVAALRPKAPPPRVKVGDKVAPGTAGSRNGRFTGNFFGG